MTPGQTYVAWLCLAVLLFALMACWLALELVI